MQNSNEALREALNMAFNALLGWQLGQTTRKEHSAALSAIRAALALPRRQCDVGTPEEQRERFILFCYRNSFRGVCSDSCKFANVNRRLGWQEIGQARCFPFWAQTPYEEGGAS